MLLDRADRDIYNAKLLLSPEGNPTNDELLDDMAAYHVQQAIEKALKYALVTFGEVDETSKEYRTHSIPALIDLVSECSNIEISDQLKLAANDITSWEAHSRYDDSPVSAREEISEAVDLYEELKAQILEAEKRSQDT